MKRPVLLVILGLVMVVSSCGSLKLTPQGCKSPGYWGKKDEAAGHSGEQVFSREYYLLTLDKEIRLRDFLKENGVSCEEVRSLRVQLSSSFFIKRKLSVFIVK